MTGHAGISQPVVYMFPQVLVCGCFYEYNVLQILGPKKVSKKFFSLQWVTAGLH